MTMSIIIFSYLTINYLLLNFLFILNDLKLSNDFIKEVFINQFLDCLNFVIFDYNFFQINPLCFNRICSQIDSTTLLNYSKLPN